MGILDEIARGGRTSALDIAKAGAQGQMDYMRLQGASQGLHMKALKMQAYNEQVSLKKRSRDILGDADLSTIEGTRKAASDAFEVGDVDLGLNLSKRADDERYRSKTLSAKIAKSRKGLNLKSSEGKIYGDILTTIENLPDSPFRNNMLESFQTSLSQKQRYDEGKATDKLSKTADDIAKTSLGLDMEDIDNNDFNALASTANTLLQSNKNIHQARSHISKYFEENSEFGRNNRIELKSEWEGKVDILVDPNSGRSFYADGNDFVGWVD